MLGEDPALINAFADFSDEINRFKINNAPLRLWQVVTMN